MKFAILMTLVLSFALAGCGAKQIKNLAVQNVTGAVCAPACSQQSEFDKETCVSVCENVADTSRKVLKDPTFEGILDVACDQACARQSVVPTAVCVPICNFLANSGKKLL